MTSACGSAPVGILGSSGFAQPAALDAWTPGRLERIKVSLDFKADESTSTPGREPHQPEHLLGIYHNSCPVWLFVNEQMHNAELLTEVQALSGHF